MKILQINCENFCSYKDLNFGFTDGLSLLTGETGSGKSTVLDAASWLLFGITSKGAYADDVCAWGAEAPTEGHTVVELPNSIIWVFRERGPKNDLFWLEDGTGDEIRGKDLTDTQRLLEARLGVTAELFLLGSYMTQFSKADSFFIAKAKDRRDTLEQIVDQEFPIKLSERASEARKVTKKERDALDLELAKVVGKLEGTEQGIQVLTKDEGEWQFNQVLRKNEAYAKFTAFDDEKQKKIATLKAKSDKWEIDSLKQMNTFRGYVNPKSFDKELAEIADTLGLPSPPCKECGAPKAHGEREGLLNRRSELKALQTKAIQDMRMYEQLIAQVNPHTFELFSAEIQENPYAEVMATLDAEINPHTKRLQEARNSLKALEGRIQAITLSLDDKNALVSRLTWLYDKSFEMRGLLMTNVAQNIQNATNVYLEKHFDAPLRIRLILEDSDKLDVEILNNGHSCGFRSLSGGERTQLKLCFAISLMKAAQDKAGVHFGQIFLDEPLAGLDTGLKVKAYGLFQELEAEFGTVLVIEHDEAFTSQFSSTYVVTKSPNGHSEINAST